VSAKVLAEAHRREYVVLKKKLLKDVLLERRTMNDVVGTLRRRYERSMTVYLRTEGTTYAAWTEHGAKVEWDEVLEATRDPAVWLRNLRPTLPEREVLKWLEDLVRKYGRTHMRCSGALELLDRLLSARPA
jgi:hypothetical protein